MTVDYTCRICKQPRAAQSEDSCPPDWVRKLAVMLTCNPCHDLRAKLRTAERQIYDSCTQLVRLATMRVDASDAASIKSRVKIALRASTLRYAQAMADYRHLVEYVWDEDFVTQLIEKPDDAAGVLRRYRAMLKTHFSSHTANT